MRCKAGALLIAAVLAGCAAAGAPAGEEWQLGYDGYGHVSEGSCQAARCLTLQPATPASARDTHAALVLSRAGWRDFTAEILVRTNFQLRRPHPNPWEVGWVLWHYLGERHFYYIALKPNGWELGKADPHYPGDQRFLVTAAHPAFPVGQRYLVLIRQRGDVISVTVNNHRLTDFTDRETPYRSGRIGLYVEDASATFQLVAVHP